MNQPVSIDEIRKMGIDWPKNTLVQEHSVIKDGRVDLQSTIDKLKSKLDYYDRQLRDAFNIKMSHGADYSDFTDNYDDHARMSRQLKEAILYLEDISERLKVNNPD